MACLLSQVCPLSWCTGISLKSHFTVKGRGKTFLYFYFTHNMTHVSLSLIRVSLSHVTFIVLPEMYGNNISYAIQKWFQLFTILKYDAQYHFVCLINSFCLFWTSYTYSTPISGEWTGFHWAERRKEEKGGRWEGRAEPRHAILIHNSWDNTGPASGKANTLHAHTIPDTFRSYDPKT